MKKPSRPYRQTSNTPARALLYAMYAFAFLAVLFSSGLLIYELCDALGSWAPLFLWLTVASLCLAFIVGLGGGIRRG